MSGARILLLLRLIAHLPLPLCRALGTLIGALLYRIPNRTLRDTRTNLALCFPELSEREREQLAHQSLIESARTFIEMPSIWLGDPALWLSRIEIGDTQQTMRRLLAQGRGLIVAAPHLGNWEVGAHLLSDTAPVTVLYRPPRKPELEQLIVDGRSAKGARLVPTTTRGVKALFKALRKGEMVAILPDQEPKGGTAEAGVFAPFFGTPAHTMVLISRLAEKTGAPVVFVYVERTRQPKPYRFQLRMAPPGIGDPDPLVAATALNLGVENLVRECPRQYQWSYRRFRATEDNGPSRYD